jgi:hypothetical protein
MKIYLTILLLLAGWGWACCQQPGIAEIKKELEKSPNSPLYVKQVLKKKFKIDTVIVTRTAVFRSLADSIAYHGREKKVYGPFRQQGGSFLVQILAKSPNLFYHVSQIFIDTTVFPYRFADSLGDHMLTALREGTTSFEQLAQTYSMGGESATQGDLGWVARGVLLPAIEKELAKRKKGDVFKIWSPNGMHIIRKTEEPRNDTGFALMMRVFL